MYQTFLWISGPVLSSPTFRQTQVGWLVVLGLLLTAAAAPAQDAVSNESQGSLRSRDPSSIGALRDNLRVFLKNSKREDDRAVQLTAIHNLCQLHAWVVADPRYNASDALKGIRATAATRLKTVARDIETAQKRSARRKVKPETPAVNSPPTHRFGGGASDSDLQPSTHPSDESAWAGYGIANAVSGSFSGGAGQLGSYVGNFGGDGDYGPDLVALIEATLNPDYWRTNGGPGSIHYYRPGLALVVTASQEMQDRVRSLLLQLK